MRYFVSVMLVIMLIGSVQVYAGTEKAADKGGAFANEFMPILKLAKEYSVEMAELMPEEHYSFKPVPEIMSFAEQNVHTASAIFFFLSKITGGENPGKDFKAEGKSKAQIIEFLKKSFDYAQEVLSKLSDKEAAVKIHLFGDVHLTKAQTFQLIRDHTTHHRGAMVIYVRLKGFKPPRYR